MPEYYLQTADDVRLCEIYGESERSERVKIATQLLGGGYLMQTVGTPTRIKKLQLRAWSRAEQQAVNAAEAENALLTAVLGDERFTGYILDAPDWSTVVNRAGIFEAEISFVLLEELGV